jgi:hypothetical protein
MTISPSILAMTPSKSGFGLLCAVTGSDGQYFSHHDLVEQIRFFGVGQMR